jgi:hypothetical protein
VQEVVVSAVSRRDRAGERPEHSVVVDDALNDKQTGLRETERFIVRSDTLRLTCAYGDFKEAPEFILQELLDGPAFIEVVAPEAKLGLRFRENGWTNARRTA